VPLAIGLLILPVALGEVPFGVEVLWTLLGEPDVRLPVVAVVRVPVVVPVVRAPVVVVVWVPLAVGPEWVVLPVLPVWPAVELPVLWLAVPPPLDECEAGAAGRAAGADACEAGAEVFVPPKAATLPDPTRAARTIIANPCLLSI